MLKTLSVLVLSLFITQAHAFTLVELQNIEKIKALCPSPKFTWTVTDNSICCTKNPETSACCKAKDPKNTASCTATTSERCTSGNAAQICEWKSPCH